MFLMIELDAVRLYGVYCSHHYVLLPIQNLMNVLLEYTKMSFASPHFTV